MTNNFTPAKAGQQSKRLSKEEYQQKERGGCKNLFCPCRC